VTSTPAKYTLWSAAGLSNKMTVDLANKKIVILVPGVYEVNFDVCGKLNTANDTQFHLRKNGTEMGELGSRTKLQTYFTCTGFSNTGSFVAGDVLEIYVEGGTTTLTVWDAHLAVKKI